MDRGKFKRAAELNSEIDCLQSELNGRRDTSPQNGLEIKVKTAYSDMGRDIERTMRLRGDIASDVWFSIREMIEKRIKELEQEFDKL